MIKKVGKFFYEVELKRFPSQQRSFSWWKWRIEQWISTADSSFFLPFLQVQLTPLPSLHSSLNDRSVGLVSKNKFPRRHSILISSDFIKNTSLFAKPSETLTALSGVVNLSCEEVCIRSASRSNLLKSLPTQPCPVCLGASRDNGLRQLVTPERCYASIMKIWFCLKCYVYFNLQSTDFGYRQLLDLLQHAYQLIIMALLQKHWLFAHLRNTVRDRLWV